MRYDDHSTGEFVDRLGEGIDGLHVQVVCRLVQQQDVRGLKGQHREDDSLPIKRRSVSFRDLRHNSNGRTYVSQTIRKLGDRVGLVGTGDTKSTDLLSPVLNVLLGVLGPVGGLEVLDGRLVIRQLISRVLRVFGELESGVLRDRSLNRRQCSGDQVQQCRFTGTVVSDDGNSARRVRI